MLNGRILLSILGALMTGTAIAVQSTLNGRAGAMIGPVRTGLLVNAIGGSLALCVILATVALSRLQAPLGPAADIGFSVSRQVFLITAAAGILGIVIIAGVSFAMQGVGVTAGLSAIIFAQLLVGLLIDAGGIGATGVILIDLRRIAGLVIMAAGVYLLVPRT